MEFGGFDDDLFSETEIKQKKTAKVDYQPKIVLPEWYTEEQTLPSEDIEKAHLYIFRANRHYYQGAWSSALEAYTRALEYVAPNNGNMRRLLYESMARCMWKSGDAGGAVEMGKKLVEESTNDHQLFCAHSALSLYYDSAGNTKECFPTDQAGSLRCCLDIRPLSSQHWIQLAKIYLQKIPSKDSREFSPRHGTLNDLEVKRHNAGCGDNGSVDCVNSQCLSERTDNVHSGKMESCPSTAKAPSVHNGYIHIDKGLEEHGGMPAKQIPSLCKDEHILHNSQGIQKQNKEGMNPSTDTSNINTGDAGEGSNRNHKSTSTSVASVFVQSRPVSLTRVNIPRQSSASTGGRDDGTLEAGELDRLSLTTEGLPHDEDNLSSDLHGGLQDDLGGADRLEDDPLMQAVKCLLKAQVILKSLQICAVALTKMRNSQLLAEVDGLLSTLHLDPAFLQDMSKKMYNEVFEKDDKEELGKVGTHGS